MPKSRHNPQFGQDQLPGSLKAAGIEYRYLAGLGGLRRPRPDSPNAGWRNTSFRGDADDMQTEEFAQVDGTRITYPSDTQRQEEMQGSLGF